MDCEGAEFSLLNPQTDPVLSSVAMIVEVHPEAGSSQMIWRRFEKTHRCERLDYIPRPGMRKSGEANRGRNGSCSVAHHPPKWEGTIQGPPRPPARKGLALGNSTRRSRGLLGWWRRRKKSG